MIDWMRFRSTEALCLSRGFSCIFFQPEFERPAERSKIWIKTQNVLNIRTGRTAVNGGTNMLIFNILLPCMNTYFQSFPSDLLSSEFCRCGYCLDMTRRAACAHTMNAFIGRLMCSFLRSDGVLYERKRKKAEEKYLNMVYLVYYAFVLSRLEQSHIISLVGLFRYFVMGVLQKGYAGAKRGTLDDKNILYAKLVRNNILQSST